MGIRTYITRLVRLVMTEGNPDETAEERESPTPNSDDDRSARDATTPDGAKADADATGSDPSAVDGDDPPESEPSETVATAAPGDGADRDGARDGGSERNTADGGSESGGHTGEAGDGDDDAEAGDTGDVRPTGRDEEGKSDAGSGVDGPDAAVADTGTTEDGTETAETDTGTTEDEAETTEADTGTTEDGTETAEMGVAETDDGEEPTENDSGWQSAEILSDEHLNAWAAAAADDVIGERDGEVNPSRYDPDRLEKKIQAIDQDSEGATERAATLRQEARRRRTAYIAALEDRLADLDERVEELEADYEQEVSQLNSLLDRRDDRIDELQTYGHESLVGPIVSEVRPDLVGAVSHDDPDAVQEAAEYGLNDLHDVLRAQGVTLIEPDEGESFDRDAHRAVTRTEDHRPEGTVVSTQQPGFRIEGEVREKAGVVISDGTGAPPDTAEPDDANEEDDGGDESDTSDRTDTDAEREAGDEPEQNDGGDGSDQNGADDGSDTLDDPETEDPVETADAEQADKRETAGRDESRPDLDGDGPEVRSEEEAEQKGNGDGTVGRERGDRPPSSGDTGK
jgi:molecular chaperone GrpE (heat shock protein)